MFNYNKRFLLASLLVYSLVRFTHQSNILRLSNENQAVFSLRYKDKRHATSPFKTIDVNNLFECVDACLYDTSCKSVNVVENVTPWRCELVAADRNTNDNYVTANGVHHYDTGWSRLTRITTPDGAHCWVPNSRSCTATANDLIVIEMTTALCQEKYAYFNFDPSTGRLIHHCTGRPLCTFSPSLYALVYASFDCPNVDINAYFYAFRRDLSKSKSFQF